MDWGADFSGWASSAWTSFINVDWTAFLQNRWARAIGMFGIVWATIWVIALVYSGYARDSVIGPVGIRTHTNRRLSGNKIVIDQTVFPFQMDGVEARCTFIYAYDDQDSKTRKIPVSDRDTLQLHIRVSQLPKDDSTRFGFETDGEVGELDQELVVFPSFDPPAQPPETIGPTPKTVQEYVATHGLVDKWTEDDEAPIVSIGASQLDYIVAKRSEHIAAKAERLNKSRNGNFLEKTQATRLSKERANVFGSYYIKMQFSKNPWFVLFKHPNRDLKMTAWLTVLTSFFSVAMDLWPVEHSSRTRSTPTIEHSPRGAVASQTTPSAPLH
jgi:hypothetical protein